MPGLGPSLTCNLNYCVNRGKATFKRVVAFWSISQLFTKIMVYCSNLGIAIFSKIIVITMFTYRMKQQQEESNAWDCSL